MQIAESIRMTSATEVDLDEALDYSAIEERVAKLEDLALYLLNPKDISYLLIDKSGDAAIDTALINRFPRGCRTFRLAASLRLAASAKKKQQQEAACVFQNLWRERRRRMLPE